ncbi:anhydro-N-acetylmuramic acid kinase [Paenibacillus sp. H1-7]|uniref:anhydro-N-acetylmuramic acid kinase n=1 Tax=Paenibacillus sp. H1-7 TaxID=2282849 RepID=UPI001EF7BAAB|nr:anhydro-N-acetylmuramic acid kinase [Paenibacillus sp. H1-7]
MREGSFPMWASYRAKQRHFVIGIMSGTSLDGVDAALVQIDTDTGADSGGTIKSLTMAAFQYVPFSKELRDRLIRLCAVDTARLDELVTAHFGVSEWYAHAVQLLLQSAGMKPSEVDAISMHGQTIWHAPERSDFPGPTGPVAVRSTLQIGETAVVAERTGIHVIGNLRARDMAAGGEGAPLAPYLDSLLFGHPGEGRIVQNIGGIGNATVIPARSTGEEVYAYDTGPGNMVVDALVREESGGRLQYDEGGAIAASGEVCEELVALFYDSDEFYRRVPPKSTGREVYGSDYAARFLAEGRRRQLRFEDIAASATALTARSIVQSYEQFVFPATGIGEVIVSGGGAHNKTMLSMMRSMLPDSTKLSTTAEHGMQDDAREAIAFAVLGHQSLMGKPGNLPAVTGADKQVILGHLTL